MGNHMNLAAIANAAIVAVNPNFTGAYYASTGNTQGADFRRAPGFASPIDLQMQVQNASGGQLRQAEGLNLQGVFRSAYILTQVQGVNRAAVKGGDKITLPLGLTGAPQDTFLVTPVTEPQDAGGWTRVLLVLQNP